MGCFRVQGSGSSSVDPTLSIIVQNTPQMGHCQLTTGVLTKRVTRTERCEATQGADGTGFSSRTLVKSCFSWYDRFLAKPLCNAAENLMFVGHSGPRDSVLLNAHPRNGLVPPAKANVHDTLEWPVPRAAPSETNTGGA